MSAIFRLLSIGPDKKNPPTWEYGGVQLATNTDMKDGRTLCLIGGVVKGLGKRTPGQEVRPDRAFWREGHALRGLDWSGWLDLNQRPPHSKCGTLT